MAEGRSAPCRRGDLAIFRDDLSLLGLGAVLASSAALLPF
jgi:hypothetical protein